MKLLIIEDDQVLNRVLTEHLHNVGYDVLSASGGVEGLELMQGNGPDLVLLDIMMPGMDGWQTCRRLREVSDVPVLILTAKGAEDDVIKGFQLGADDYIKKPFNLQELELRVEAVLRRSASRRRDDTSDYNDGVLQIDLGRRMVVRRGDPVHLTPTEFRLLSYLVRHRDRVVPHSELLSEVWGPRYVDDTASLSVYIRYLREKLEENPATPRYICTEWGVGYRFAVPRAPVV
jgi:two-component system KDP operon response regulator KdpE